MKTSLIVIVSSFIFVFLTVDNGFTQDVNCTDMAAKPEVDSHSSMIVITEDDYSCFRSIECLKSNQKYQERGWNILFNTNVPFPSEYVLNGEFNNVHLFARYNRNGTLIESTLQRKNTILPSVIRRYLVTGNLAEWTMIENEMVVNDFEAEKTEYKVILEKEGIQQTLYFDYTGNRIQQFAGH